MALRKKSDTAKTPTKKGGSSRNYALGDTPIVISGGSVLIEYPARTDDGFDDDGSTANGKTKLRHRGNPTLKKIEITNGGESVTLLSIDLDELGVKRNCKIKIYYR